MRFNQILFHFIIIFLLLSGCSKKDKSVNNNYQQYITILGIAQDAGYPQIDCSKLCCLPFYKGIETKKRVSCLAVIDNLTHEKWLFDATPDIVSQTQDLKMNHIDNGKVVNGIFLTHAHIGHYTGLMHLGREALGAKQIPVFAMPKIKQFLETNGPWSQLVKLENITLKVLQNEAKVTLNEHLSVTPFLVPHRDEYSETVGFKIQGKQKSALFIPDINKWYLWKKDIIEEVKKVDYAFLDATFFRDGEIARPMSEVPHPFIEETVTLFKDESLATKNKVIFIHFNHSNPAILSSHKLQDSIANLGFNFAKEGANYAL